MSSLHAAGQRHVIAAIAACAKPDAAGLQQLVGPVGEHMQKASALTEGRRSGAFNHCKAVAEALQGLSWVVYSGPSSGRCILPSVGVPGFDMNTTDVLTLDSRCSSTFKGAAGPLQDRVLRPQLLRGHRRWHPLQ